MPELMDLGDDGYVPEIGSEMPQASMKSLSRRPNRHLMDEARYTDRNLENTMKQPLRRRPIEFVKAQEVYDPSKEMIEKLKLANNHSSLVEDMQLLKVEAQPLKLSDLRDSDGSDVDADFSADEDGEDATDELLVDEVMEEPVDETTNDATKGRTEIDMASGSELELASTGEQDVLEKEIEGEKLPETETENDILSEQEELSGTPDPTDSAVEGGGDNDADEDEVEEEEVKAEEVEEDEENEEEEEEDQEGVEEDLQSESDEDEYDDLSDGFVLDCEADEDILHSLDVPKISTKQVIQQLQARKPVHVPQNVEFETPVAHLEHDPYLTVGKVMLRTSTSPDGSIEATIPRNGNSKSNSKSATGFKELSPDYLEEESEDTDEEAAFEDYMAQVMQANLMDDDFDIGSLNDESDESDEFDGASDEDLNSEEEGLEEILSLARNQKKGFSIHDIEPTQTLKKKGKGKNLRLDINDEIEMELRADLMEQFQYQRQSRKLKKLRKKEKLHQEAVSKNDLSIKYDYMLHIKEIKEEFESLLHDASRESVRFPPLDGHGNKTLSKLAKHYNMKCIRCGGNGLLMYMKIAKVRKTFHYLPDYNQINYIMRQRPVFKRSDVKTRTKEEIQESDGKRTRNGPKNDAYVKEGDIVGGKAPEIGANNIGRKLLEKLGWVKGEGLGAHGNKGISEPLLATVKKSKTGLK